MAVRRASLRTTAANARAPFRFLTTSSFALAVLLVLPSLLHHSHSSASYFADGTPLIDHHGNIGGAAPSTEFKTAGSSSSSSSALTLEDSAREVPTGPDPLHHNHKPTSP